LGTGPPSHDSCHAGFKVFSAMTSSPSAANQLEKEQLPSFSRLSFSPTSRTIGLALVLAACVFAVYIPVIHNSFLNYDDNVYITINPPVIAGLTLDTVKWAFTTFHAENYHPLTWMSHALDCQLFGLNPAGHHEVNVLLQAANAVLVFLLLQSLTGFTWRSLFVAALFGLHPINVESVAWAAERKNVLSMLFFLLALHAYVAYVRQPRIGRYLLIALFFTLGLLSKPQIITLPCLLLLLDYWPLDRIAAMPADGAIPKGRRDSKARKSARASVRTSAHTSIRTSADTIRASASSSALALPRLSIGRLVLEKVPLFALSAASASVTMAAQQAGGAVQSLSVFGPLLRLETAAVSYVTYIGKAFWPANLVVLYPHPSELYPAGEAVGAILLLVAITVAVLRARDRRFLAVGWFWFLGAFVPMIGFVQAGLQAMADRYAYIPFLGLFMMLTWLIADWAQARQVRAIWLAIPAVATLFVFSALTYRQIGCWHDVPTFWTHTIERTENNFMAHDLLADYLSKQGRPDEAAAHSRAAVAIRPDDMPAHYALGGYEQAHGNLQAATEHFQIVAFHASNGMLRAVALRDLGLADYQAGDLSASKQFLGESLQIVPNDPKSIVGIGLISQKQGDLYGAVRAYSQTVAIQPSDVGYLLLAQALEKQGHTEQAQAMVERAVRLSPNLTAARTQVASLLGN
jgi:protein O-mannosyl-transferase